MTFTDIITKKTEITGFLTFTGINKKEPKTEIAGFYWNLNYGFSEITDMTGILVIRYITDKNFQS